jgi:hypothetical protein
LVSTFAGTGSYLPLTFYTGGSERVRIDTSGNVGIGNTAPAQKLDVGSTTGTNVIRVGGGNTGAADGGGVYVANNGTSVAAFGNYSNIIGGGYDASALLWATGNMRFVTAGGANVRMTIDTSGNVGIGAAASAAVKLHVTGTYPSSGGNCLPITADGNVPSGTTGSAQIFKSGAGTAAGSYTLSSLIHFYANQGSFGASSAVTSQMGFYAESGLTGASGNNFGFYSNLAAASGRWNFYANGTAANYFAGDVGIGNAPSCKLDVLVGSNQRLLMRERGSGAVCLDAALANNSAYQTMVVNGSSIAFQQNATTRMTLNAGLGVGTAADPGAGGIFATANITAYYSDARLKDFKGKIGDALYKVSQLNGYYYTENEKAEEFGYNNKELQVGVSAQEVQAVLPEVIAPAPFDMDAENKSKSGEDYMTVRYEKLVPLLIEAIKELKAEVEALKAGR